MKYFIFLFFIFINTYAQEKGIQATYSLFYNYHNPISRSVDLYFNEEKSYSVERMNTTNQLGETSKKPELPIENSEMHSSTLMELDVQWQDVIIAVLKNKNQLYKTEQDPFLGFFVTIEEVPQINWKISKEQKKVENIDCVKATTTFRGTEWEIWFAPEIPMSFGPWKLQSAPGLILEARNKEATVHYLLKELKYNIDLPPFAFAGGKKLPLKEYVEYIEENSNFEQHTDRDTKLVVKTENPNRLEKVFEWDEETKK